MRAGIIGINHKLAHLKLREELAKGALKRFTLGIYPCLVLSTCNRTEIYFSSEDLSATHSYILSILREEVTEEFDQKLYSYFGYDCFLHLCRVAAGLDSAIVAETEIQGQVKMAYDNASKTLSLPKELHYLFQKALKISKQVRSELPMRQGMPGLEHAIVNVGKHLFKTPEEKKILVVGASSINFKIMQYLNSKNIHNITLCNRTSPVANTTNKVLSWDDLHTWSAYDWIIFGTKAPHHLIKKDQMPKECVSKKLIIDLSVPRNVDPSLAKDPRVTLLNIDQINRQLHLNRQKLDQSICQAEYLISSLVHRHVDLFRQKISKVVAISA